MVKYLLWKGPDHWEEAAPSERFLRFDDLRSALQFVRAIPERAYRDLLYAEGGARACADPAASLARLILADRIRIVREEAEALPLLPSAPPLKAPPPPEKPVSTEKTWIEFQLLDEDGLPMANEEYQLVQPDGQVVKGVLDAAGVARASGIDPGLGTISWFLKPTQPKKGGGTAEGLAPTGSMEIVSLTFLSDHERLYDQESDWTPKGKRYPKPEWKGGHPVSHSMDQTVRVKLKFKVGAAAKGQMAVLNGISGSYALRFMNHSIPMLTPGEHEMTLTAYGPLPKKIHKLDASIQWSLSFPGGAFEAKSGPHPIYVTYAAPKESDEKIQMAKDVPTKKRMALAVDWVEPMGTTDPHEIVAKLMKKFPYYTLSADPKVPEEYKHPNYQNSLGGAWCLADHVKQSAECQAIVRLVRKILRQLGIPGEADAVVVWADPDVNGGATALEAKHGSKGAGLGGRTKKTILGTKLQAILTDSKVEKGKTYPPSHSKLPGGGTSPGFNNFEACLKFEHGGKTRYYGGGADVYDSRDAVLKCFSQLVWGRPIPLPSGDTGYEIDEIVRTY